MTEVRIGSQGRLVIPAELRAAMGAEEGAVYVATVDEDGALTLRTPEQAIHALQRTWAGATDLTSPVEELLADRRAEAASDA